MKTPGTFLLAVALAACGGSDTPAAAMNPWLGTVAIGGTTMNVTVTYSSTGVTPSSITLAEGGTITFVNNDTVSHWPSSGLYCTAVASRFLQCPWLNTTASVAAGTSAPSSGPATATPTTCSLLDRNHPPPCGGGAGY